MTGITATLILTVGLTFYGGDFVDQPLYCGGVYPALGTDPWAAVPIEWFLSGAVACGDTLTARLTNGRVIRVPIRDAGCHLHHPTWDTGRPYGADFPSWPWWRQGAPSGTGEVVVQRQDGSWWDPPPLLAWATDYCSGPLSWHPIPYVPGPQPY